MAARTDYEYINAKLHSMKSTMFEGGRLDVLVRAQGLDELARSLSSGQGDVGDRAGQIERFLTEAYSADLDKVRRNLGDRAAQFLMGFWRKADVENLKVVLRHWFARGAAQRVDEESVEELLVGAPTALPLPVRRMLGAETLEEAVILVPLEPAREKLTQIVASYPNAPQPFIVEIGLDAWYCEQLMDGLVHLGRHDRRIARELIGLDIDATVLLWAMRLGLNYESEAEVLSALLAPLATNITNRELQALCSATNDTQRLAAVPSLYRKCLDGVSPADLPACELQIYSHIDKMARRFFRRLTADIAGVVGYYFIRRTEFINLVRAVQAVRLGLPAEDARSVLLPNAADK